MSAADDIISTAAQSDSGLSFSSAEFLEDDDYLNDSDLPPITPGEYQSALEALENLQGDVDNPPQVPNNEIPSEPPFPADEEARDRRHSFDGIFPHGLVTQHARAEREPIVPQVSSARPPIPQTAHSRGGGTAATRSAASKRRLWQMVLEKFNERVYPYSYFLLSKRPGQPMKGDSLCMKCEFMVTGIKPNELREHLMCCPKLPLSIRRRIWRKSKSSRLPPLLPDPPNEHTVASLKKLFGCRDCTVDENGVDVDYDREPTSSTIYRPTKRQKLQARSIYECSEGEAERISKKVLSFIVDRCLPFTTVKREMEFTGSFHEMTEEARLGYVAHIPSSTKLSTTMLNNMYNDIKRRVQNSMRVMLRSGYTTIMFDGWRDTNGAPVVNVLARVIGESRESARTFFLGKIYTGATACTAQRYVSIVEEIMKDYGGMERIVAIVTDNASSCRNARNLLARKYGKLVACQDQAHIADLLMKYLGEIPWIESTLATLSPIPAILRAFVKLNQRLRELMEDYNISVTGESTLNLSEFHEVVPSDDSVQIDDPDQYEAYPDREETERHVRAQERAFLNTAIMMKLVSNVRSASSEKLLEEFVRLRPVLLQVIEDPSFDDLYPARDDLQKTARQKCFIDPIQSETLLTKVKNLLTIFRSCRIYLRVFDGQGAISSDVYETTKLLRERLEALSATDFPEPSSQNKNRLLQVVRNRSEGPLPGMKRVQVRLTSDLHVAACLMDPYRCPVETTSQEMMEALRRHMVSYLEGTDIEERKRQSLITEMVLRYLDVRNKWQDINLFQRGRETRASDAHKFGGFPEPFLRLTKNISDS